jgi:hypothetical protein
LAIIGRLDRLDGDRPAYRILTPCCSNEQTVSAWVITSVRTYNPDRVFVVHCDHCGCWRPTTVPAVNLHA